MKKLSLFLILICGITSNAHSYTPAYCSQQLDFCNESLGKAKQKLRAAPTSRDSIMLKAGKTPGCKRWLCDCGSKHSEFINDSDYTRTDITFFKGSLFIKSGVKANSLKSLICGK